MKNKTKNILSHILIFLIPIFLLIVVFNFRPYKTREIPVINIENEESYITTYLNNRRISDNFKSNGTIYKNENTIEIIFIEKKDNEVEILKKVGDTFNENETIFRKNNVDIFFDYDGMIMSIIESEENFKIEVFNKNSQTIKVGLKIEEFNKLKDVKSVFITKDTEIYNTELIRIDTEINNNIIEVELTSDYKGLINENVEVTFEKSVKDSLAIRTEFITYDSGKTYLVVEINNEMSYVPVILGIKDGDYFEIITSRITSGTKIFKKVGSFYG